MNEPDFSAGFNVQAEYGPHALAAARIACRTEAAYPVRVPDVGDARVVPVAGPDGLVAELAGWM